MQSTQREGAESVYGAYLAARYAGTRQDVQDAADLYADAMRLEPGSGYISERAFYAALIAGDFDAADSAARSAIAFGGEPRLPSLYLAASSIAEGAPAPDLFVSQTAGRFDALASQILHDWSDVTEGRASEAASRRLSVSAGVSSHVLIHRALVLEAAGMKTDAEGAYRAADAALDLANYSALALGRFLERERRWDEARTVYDRQVARGRPDPEISAAIERADRARRRPPAYTPAEAAARALFPPAALFANAAPADHAILYLRMIQRLDPEFARNTIFLASILEEAGYQEEALAAYQSLEGSAFGERAALEAAWLSFRMGEGEPALDLARREVERTGDSEAVLLLADLYRALGRCEEAIPLYREGETRRADEDLPPEWRLPFFEGVCWQILGDWDAAEARFLEALTIAPDEPRLLNHVGYNWLVLNKNTDRAVDMIERAVAAEPENGAIVDSYGWALFKLGRFEEAVTQLERAVELQPYDPTLNWHLGDAYWRVGREREARFQWRRALDLDPEPREIPLLEARLDGGLDAAPADLE
jgi:tetratricopeptide (TPR) repeat protein